MHGDPETRRAFLRQRNALWAQLRATPEGTPDFERVVAELATLIGWPRERILAGLGHETGQDEWYFPQEP